MILNYKPHSDASTWTAVTCATPWFTALPFVSVLSASNERLKPSPAWSIAVKVIVFPVSLSVSFQHVPQFGEPKPEMTDAPPMFGNVGKEPNVGNCGVRFEQATMFVLAPASS